jgi:LPXTG-motif cell wall-anchored protein
VDLTLPEEVQGRDFHLYHIHDGQKEELSMEKTGSVLDGTGLESVSGIQFVTGSFSEFVLQYTVDFEYSVDGKTYEFSLPGGGFVSLADLVEALGIAGDANDVKSDAETGVTAQDANGMLDVTASDAAKRFAADVESVEFSSPELVWVGKADSETTVGALKEENGLECEYSAELTEEQIAEIDAQTVEAGDWALISVQAFTSEESLTVTMKNGEQWTVKVTDAQISTQVMTAEGETYTITVTYGPEAEIPDGATLEAVELLPETEGYDDYYKRSQLQINSDDILEKGIVAGDEARSNENIDLTFGVDLLEEPQENYITNARIFDVSIVHAGEEIEPKAPVEVTISCEESIRQNSEEIVEVVHFAKAGVEVIDAEANSDGKEIVFQQDSFSVMAVVSHQDTRWRYVLVLQNGDRYYALNNNGGVASVNLTYNEDLGKNTLTLADNQLGNYAWTYLNNDEGERVTNGNRTYYYANGKLHTTRYGRSNYLKVTNNGTLSTNNNYDSGWQVIFAEILSSESPSYSQNLNVHFVAYSSETGSYEEIRDPLSISEESGNLPRFIGDQLDLEVSIPGYRYVTTRLNEPVNGVQISSLLQTDAPYMGTNYENNSNGGYTSNPTSAGNYSYWRYRQLSSASLNPTGDGWYYSSTEPVTGLGVTKPVSFAESDKDIYVIYEKGSMSIGNDGGDDTDLGELNAPKTDKQVDSNHDGTYDVTLSAKSEKKNAESSTKANVVIVLDTSWSMYEKDAGNGKSRLAVAKSAIGSLADKLFALNKEEDDTIELAFITFAQRVRNELEMKTIYSGSDASEFKGMINGLDCASGTNWDDALYAADHIYFDDNDPTYIVFVTDGDPISCAHPYGTYDDWDGGTYYNGNIRSNYQYALAAKNQADLIVGHNKTLYTIGAFGEISNLQAIGGIYLGQANNTTAINGYFDDIISDIQSALGYQDITINDGITALSSTGLARGDISSLRYYRSGGTNTNGSEKYDHTANDGHGVEWTDAPAAYLLEVKSENGTTKYYKNGTLVSLSTLTDLTEEEYLKKYPVGSRTVVWDINQGSEELLEDGVTYTMIFTMWPSQEAYDLIADLNNGTISYDDDLSQAEKDQVYLGDDNVYYLKTNTKATVDYTSVKLVNGQVSGTPTSASAPIEDPKGKMNLDTSIMTVRKEFAHLINEADPYEEIVFYLLVDGKYYNKDGSLSDTLDESKVYAINLPKNGNWEDTIYIAPGLMRGGEILETGHNYSLAEKIVSGNPYEYEFVPQTVRPMVITAVPTFLVKKDSFNTNTENKKEYTFNDAESSYTEVNGKSDADGTYYVASENNGSLVGVNHKTSELDITKIVHDPDNLIADVQENAETFTYRVTLQIPDGCDPSGIVGYEYVPRTQSNAFTLFGYQTGQSAFADDIKRFNGKTFRAWNTLVYDALIEYDRVTENGKTVIKARRDDDGNIIWKIPAADGYHTITYDMTLKQDEVIRFTNLPTGTKYTIQEIYANKYPADNAGGKTDGRIPVTDESNLSAEGYEIETVQHTGGTLSADKTTVEGTIDAPDTRYYNQFKNKKVTESKTTRVELKVKKVVEDYTWGQEYYRFTLKAGTAAYTDTEGGSGISPMPEGTQDSAVSIYDSTAEHTLSFGMIRYTRPGIYTYTVSEYDNSRNLPNVQFASPVTLTVTVAADNSGKLTVQTVEDDKGTTVYSAETATALAAGLTTQTNTTKKIHIKKVDKNHSNTVLADAVFEIRSDRAKLYLQEGKLLSATAVDELIEMSVSADGAEHAMEEKDILSSFTLGAIDISGFSLDTVYELKELSAPAGYIITAGSVYFKAVQENGTTYLRLTDQSGTVLTGENDSLVLDNDSATVAENTLTLSVKNEPGAALPNTGGPGTNLIYLLGLMLTGLAGAGLLMKRRRRNAA